MRLGFYYHIPALSKNNGIYVPGYLGRFIDSLASSCEQVTCFLHSPRTDEISRMDYQILSSNVRLVEIGPHTSVMERTVMSRKYVSLVKRHTTEMDVLLVRGPTPLLPALANASSVPTALLLVGDYLTGIADLPQPRWRKEIIRIWSYWNKSGQNRAVRRSLTFVNSRALYNELKDKTPDLQEIRTTTLTQDDFFPRSDVCQTQPYRLLYVGRMDRAKGLLQMVGAVSLLVERGEDVTIDLVGWAERSDPILDEIQAFANAKRIADRIHFWGPYPLGPELFKFYQQADIFLIASLASEGFPRAIWEAMANSLPVVATRVGSIPAFVEGAAELVLPGQADALAEGILRLIRHPELRQELIAKGFELARGNTLEVQGTAMIGKIEAWLEGQYV